MKMSVNALAATSRARNVSLGVVFFLLAAAIPLAAQTEKWVAWEAKGDTLLSQDNFKGALKLYTKVVKATKLKDKAGFSALYKRAVCYYSMGDLQASLDDLNVFIPLFPQAVQAHILLSFIYKDLHDNVKQLAALQKVLELQPSNPEVIKIRGGIYIGQEKFVEAKNDLLFVRTVRDDAQSEAHLGYTYYRLNQIDSALIALNKSIELNESYIPAYLYAGSFCIEQENFDLALKYLNVAVRLDPENTSILFYRGIALVEKGNLDEWCSCLNTAFYAGEDDAGGYLTEFCYGGN